MATCGYSRYVGGYCGASSNKPDDTVCTTLNYCDKDIRAHVRYLHVSDSTLKTEPQVLLARAGVFDYTDDTLDMTICPQHRDAYGIRWRLRRRLCCCPVWWRLHGEKNKRGEKGITLVQSRQLYILTNHLVPIGSPICKTCRSSIKKQMQEQANIQRPGQPITNLKSFQAKNNHESVRISRSNKKPLDEEETKWRVVLSSRNEALYYENKITGLQRWTTYNCVCSKSKFHSFNSPILPCCVKEIPKITPDSMKDCISNEHGVASESSVDLFSKEAFSLCDIIKDVATSPSQSQKRKYDTENIQETKANDALTHSPKKKIRTLWAHKTDKTLLNNVVSMTTRDPSTSQCNNPVSLTTEDNNSIQMESSPVDDFLAKIGLQRAPKSVATATIPKKSVSMATKNDLTAVSVATQSVAVDVTVTAQSGPASVPMSDQSDTTNNSTITMIKQSTDTISLASTDNTASNEQVDCPVDDGIMNNTKNEATHTLSTSTEHINKQDEEIDSGSGKKALDGYNLRSSGEDGADLSEYPRCDYLPKPSVKTSESKKEKKPKEKCAIGRPQKKTFFAGQNLKKPETSAEITNDEQPASELEHSDIFNKKDITEEQDSQKEHQTNLSNSQVGSVTENIHANESITQISQNGNDNIIDVVVDDTNTNNTEGNASEPSILTTTINLDAHCKKMLTKKCSALKISRAVGRPRKNKNTALYGSVSSNDVPQLETSCNISKQQNLLEQSINDLLEMKHLSGDPNNSVCSDETNVNGKAMQSDHDDSIVDIISLHDTDITNTLSFTSSSQNTSSVSTSTECKTKPTGTNKLTNECFAPSIFSNLSLKEIDERLNNLSPPKIKFISDNNLKSGAIFFTGKDTTSKNIESIAETLRCSPGKAPTRENISLQTSTWLVDVLSELDMRKRTQLPKEQEVSSTNPYVELDKTESISSKTATAFEVSHLLDGNYNNFPNTSNEMEYIEPGNCGHPSVKDDHPIFKEAVQPSEKSHTKQVQNKPTILSSSQHALNKVTPLYGIGASNLTEVDASYIDLSWRIVTSEDGENSTSLSQLHKLIPVHIHGEAETGACSFLGVQCNSDKQVIAKILNTGVPEVYQNVFVFKHAPNIVDDPKRKPKRDSLSFKWECGKVSVLPKSQTKPSRRQPKQDHGDSFSAVQLPKPLKLPEAGSKVYLGEFQFVDNRLEFIISFVVAVALSPRPTLSMPAGALSKRASSKIHIFKVLSKELTDMKELNKPVTCKVDTASQTDDDLYKPCHVCGEHVNNFGESKIHRHKHAKALGLICSECPKRFTKAGRLSVHIATHQPLVIGKCLKCESKFQQLQVAKDGEYLNQVCSRCYGDLFCKKCSKEFISREELCHHVVETHGMPCRICPLKFIYKTDLVKHMKVVHQIYV